MDHGSSGATALLGIADSGGFRTPVLVESVHPFWSFRTPRRELETDAVVR